jgi:hypothetical protein
MRRLASIALCLLLLLSSNAWGQHYGGSERAALFALVQASLEELDRLAGFQHDALWIELRGLRRDAGAPPKRNDAWKLGLDALSGKIGDELGDLAAPSPLHARQDAIGIRTEAALGRPNCPEEQKLEPHCVLSPWLSTRSRSFHTIEKTHYFRGQSNTPQGVRMSASFVAERDATQVAIHFSAEAWAQAGGDILLGSQGRARERRVRAQGGGGGPAANSGRMHVRALLDGEPAQPSSVVFAAGPARNSRSFIFTATVDKGIHTVEMQWMTDNKTTAWMRNANLLVRTAREGLPTNGTLTTLQKNGQTSHAQNAWADIPDMHAWVYSTGSSIINASLSAVAWITGCGSLALRALSDGMVAQPADQVFARGDVKRARTATFGFTALPKGWHQIRFQWLASVGSAFMKRRSLALSNHFASDTHPTHSFVAAPSGPAIENSQPLPPLLIPDMQTQVFVPEKGNGEVAVLFDAEVSASFGAQVSAFLEVDGQIASEAAAQLADGGDSGQTRSYVFEAKHLAPGLHVLALRWNATGGTGFMGDRSMSVLSETGFIPDIAEAPRFGGGHIGVDQDEIGGIEPLIGRRRILTLLWDPHLCAGDLGSVGGGPCDEPHTSDIPPEKVRHALYGHGEDPGDIVPDIGDFALNNVRSYYLGMSGGRFAIRDAGVLGWFDALRPAGHYFGGGHATCDEPNDGFEHTDQELVAEAVHLADPQVDYSQYDVNGDGELSTNELGILVVVPRNTNSGSSQQPLRQSECAGTRMQRDGVLLPRAVIKWNSNLIESMGVHQFAVAAHELMHLLAGLDDIHLGGVIFASGEVLDDPANTGASFVTDLSHPDDDRWDLYTLRFTSGSLAGQSKTIQNFDAFTGEISLTSPLSDPPPPGTSFEVRENHATYPASFSLMASNSGTTTHLDPLNKLALGWVTPRIVEAGGTYDVEVVEDSDQVLILPRTNNEQGPEEFYVVENRFNNRPGHYDSLIGGAGIAVWHIVSGPPDNLVAPLGVPQAAFDAANASSTTPETMGQQGRRGIRLIKPWTGIWSDGGAVSDPDDDELWDWTDYPLQSAPCPNPVLPDAFFENTLSWADCNASGYRLEMLSPVLETMPVRVEVP